MAIVVVNMFKIKKTLVNIAQIATTITTQLINHLQQRINARGYSIPPLINMLRIDLFI